MLRLILALAYACAAAPAWAAAEHTAETAFSLPFGDIVVQVCAMVLNIAAAIAVPLLLAFLTSKYPILKAFLSERMIQTQVDLARDAGINAVQGAMHGKEVKVDAGSKVVAEGAKYLIRKADVNVMAAHAIKAAGGPEQIARRIWAGLHLDAEATKDNTLIPALNQIAAYQPKPAAPAAAPLHRPVVVPPKPPIKH